MSYTLVPVNASTGNFTANHPVFLALLQTGTALCPDEYAAVRFQQPKDSETPDAEYRHGWGPNDGQRVIAEGAAGLGRAIGQIADTAAARRSLLESWQSWWTGPADDELDQRAGNQMQAKLRDFSEFLIQSDGFEIW